MLKMTNPQSSPDRVDAAWKQCNGDSVAAGKLLADPTFQSPTSPEVVLSRIRKLKPDATAEDVDFFYKQTNGDINATVLLLFDKDANPPATQPPPSSSATPSPVKDVAYVHERDARRKTEREMLHAKQKQSAIYARRETLNEVGSSAANAINIPESPTPVPPPRPAPRRVKKVIVDSDSASAFDSDSSDDDTRLSPESMARSDDYYQTQALKWFNEINNETLMELTGTCIIAVFQTSC
jgi:hypothetical protein